MLQRLSTELFRHFRVQRGSPGRVASAPMKFPGRITSGVLMLIFSCAALAQSELDVRIKPSNDELKANIEGYVGSLGDRDEEALLRFSRGAEEQARKADNPNRALQVVAEMKKRHDFTMNPKGNRFVAELVSVYDPLLRSIRLAVALFH